MSFATSARLLPSDVRVTVEQSLPGNLSMEDWQMMKEVIAAVQAIPDAANAPPGAVLEHVLTALRAADAKVLDIQRTIILLTVRLALPEPPVTPPAHAQAQHRAVR